MNDRRFLWRADRLALAAVLLLAAALRFSDLGGSSLWSDEGNTWALIQRSFSQIARAAAADIHPPGYYWLLKVWAIPFGTSAAAMRAFSALCGVLLVALIAAVAARSAPPGLARRWLPVLAALLAALNPFQIYYSQEARMYALLALCGAGMAWALLALWDGAGHRRILAEAVFVLSGVVGLWTHYSFPVGWAALIAAWAVDLAARRTPVYPARRFLLLNALILLAFLPWLPTAVERVLAWPQGGERLGLAAGLTLTLRTLLSGPLRRRPEVQWLWLAVTALLPLLGAFALRRVRALPLLALWLAAPVALMFALGLFSDAFLKFLLVASPPWCVLAAAAAFALPANAPRPLRIAAPVTVGIGAVVLAVVALPDYYRDPAARDNYAGIAAYVHAVSDPATGLVLLDAPGQQEVWRYYDPGLPVAALPAQRPPDAAHTEAALVEATEGKRDLFALFWATDEADSTGIVENWLAQHAFKGFETWQGNVRFARYALGEAAVCAALDDVHFAGRLRLAAFCTEQKAPAVPSGDVALVELRWAADAPLDRPYAASLQLLDQRGQVVAQQDAPLPDLSHGSDNLAANRRGLAIPPGTPPGDYRLALAVYDPATGTRLPMGAGDMADLGTLAVAAPARAFPIELLPVGHRANAPMGPVTLVGYDLHKAGFAHAPETPVNPGDPVQLILYWQAPDPLPPGWPTDLTFTLQLGGETLNAPLAGGEHPTGAWQPGELVRAGFTIPYDSGAGRPLLSVGDDRLTLAPLP